MYPRTTQRKNKDGSIVRYIQLAHNRRDGHSTTAHRTSGARIGRCFSTTIREGYFAWDFTPAALDYEERLLAGRYVITTSLDMDAASTADVVRHYKMLANVERRFRVMKDFLGLRPVHHRTESRVRAHIALSGLRRGSRESPGRRGALGGCFPYA